VALLCSLCSFSRRGSRRPQGRHFTLLANAAHCHLCAPGRSPAGTRRQAPGLVAPRHTLYTWRPLGRGPPGELAWFRLGLGQVQVKYKPGDTVACYHSRPKRLSPGNNAGLIMALFIEFLAQEWILVGALLVVIIMLIKHESNKSGPSLTPQQAINLVNSDDGIFVDLRDAADFNKGHISGSVNIPAAKVAERMVELEKYKDKPIVLVCKMGQQSGVAGKQLKSSDYEEVYKMSGGMMEWGNLQLPTAT